MICRPWMRWLGSMTKPNSTPDLLEVLERRLPLTSAVPERVALRTRMATLLEGALRRADAALDAYRGSWSKSRAMPSPAKGLERMLDNDTLRLRAAEVLEPIYQLLADRPALVRMSELFATYLPDLQERISRLKRVAELRTISVRRERRSMRWLVLPAWPSVSRR